MDNIGRVPPSGNQTTGPSFQEVVNIDVANALVLPLLSKTNQQTATFLRTAQMSRRVSTTPFGPAPKVNTLGLGILKNPKVTSMMSQIPIVPPKKRR